MIPQPLEWIKPEYLNIKWPEAQCLATPNTVILISNFLSYMTSSPLIGVRCQQVWINWDGVGPKPNRQLDFVTYYFYKFFALAITVHLDEHDNPNYGFYRIGCWHNNAEVVPYPKIAMARAWRCLDCGATDITSNS